MTKIENTRQEKMPEKHERSKVTGNIISMVGGFMQVTDAELVLVECKPDEAKLLIHDTTLHLYDYKKEHKEFLWLEESKYLRPISISKNEKIEVGDKAYDTYSGLIVDVTKENFGSNAFDYYVKILALPEHFSPQSLKDIVDGKLREGKCLVECERVYYPAQGHGTTAIDYNKIKLNPHITIHNVGEKMVPLSIAEKAFEAGYNYAVNLSHALHLVRNSNGYVVRDLPNKTEWFKQNVHDKERS